MSSKFDFLREGKAVEIRPGVAARLNKEKKQLEMSSGKVLNVANDPHFFPRDENELALSRSKEKEGKYAKESGPFLYQLGKKGIAGAAGDWVSYITQSGNEYSNTKQAQRHTEERLSKKHPYQSGAATVASFIPDIIATRGMSALAAAPALAVAHAGPRIISEPDEVAKEAAISAAGGFILDKGAGFIGKVAQRRGASRAIPAEQEAVRKSNMAGQQATQQANAMEAQQHNTWKQNVKTTNKSRLQQHETDLNTRQNDMIKAENKFKQEKLARDIEIAELKNKEGVSRAQIQAAEDAAKLETKAADEQYKLAKSQHEEALRQMPELQKRAQAEYSEGVVKTASEIETNFPKDSKIPIKELEVNSFVDDLIEKKGLRGSKEGSQARRILNSIFPEGEFVGGRELSRRYKALEDAIQRSTPETRAILTQFKEHLGKRLPVVLEDAVAYHKVSPLLKRVLATDVKAVVGQLGLTPAEQKTVMQIASTNANSALREGVTPTNFIQKVQSGELSKELAERIITVEDVLFEKGTGNLAKMSATAQKKAAKEGTLPYIMKNAEQRHAYFVDNLAKRIQDRLNLYEVKAGEAARKASQNLGKGVKKTYGTAPPQAAPFAPVAPGPGPANAALEAMPPFAPQQIPPRLTVGPQTPPMPQKPTLMAEPVRPQPRTFNPQPEPALPPPQGFAESAGDALERSSLLGGRGLIDNPVTKLAGLKYLLGKAALPAEAGYMALKGLTSPTAAGEVARMTFKQGGIQAIDSWAQKYPSYQNGILQDPRERRSLTKEVEDDPSIPLEQKAVVQSKINRGKPIEGSL